MPKKGVSEERKTQIMESLYKCLLEKQFHEITIKDIAAEAGINHGMIYYFYENKEDVLLHFIDYIAGNYESDFLKYMETEEAHGLEGKDILRHAMNYSNDRITLNRDLSKIFIEVWGIANHNTKVQKKLSSLYNRWILSIREILEKCGMSNERAERMSHAMVSFFEGNALFSIVFEWKSDKIRINLDEFQDRILEMVDE